MPPADGKSLASWPIAVAAQMQAIRASPTESGRAWRASGTEMKIEYATAAAGAMCVIDWKSTCGSPIECSRRCSKRRGSVVAASIRPPCRGPRKARSLNRLRPRRRVVNPPSADHRRHDLDGRKLLRLQLERVAVEHDQIGEESGHELAAAVLVAGQPRRVHGRRQQRL